MKNHPAVKKFLKDLKSDCKKYEVDLVFSQGKELEIPGGNCNGYFWGNDDGSGVGGELAVATGQSFEKWFPILIHEASHMRQWIEGSKYWTDLILPSKANKSDLLFYWIDGVVELSLSQLIDYSTAARNVEWDCERRAIKMIKELALPVDVKHYTQRANSYIMFYYAIAETRKWYKIGLEPYSIESIVSQMPTRIIKKDFYFTDKERKIFSEIVKEYEGIECE